MWNGVGDRWSATIIVERTLGSGPSRAPPARRRSPPPHACVSTRVFTPTKGYIKYSLSYLQELPLRSKTYYFILGFRTKLFVETTEFSESAPSTSASTGKTLKLSHRNYVNATEVAPVTSKQEVRRPSWNLCILITFRSQFAWLKLGLEVKKRVLALFLWDYLINNKNMKENVYKVKVFFNNSQLHYPRASSILFCGNKFTICLSVKK